MKTLTFTVCALALTVFSSAQACEYMNKVTKNLKQHTGATITDNRSAVPVTTEKKLLVDVKKSTTEIAN